jgi:hypothetical protein
MMYQFKQAVRVGRTTFPLGVREVPEEMVKHPHFQGFLKAGYVKVAGAEDGVGKKLADLPVLPPPSSAAAKRSQEAAKAIQAQDSAPAPDQEIGAPDEAPEAAPAADEAVEDAQPKKKGKGR